MRSKIFIAALCLCLPFLACVPNLAGGSTETTNSSVAAMLRNPDGSPAVHAKVRFYPIHYNPRTGGLAKTLAALDSTTTDTNGNYSAKLDTGAYNVLAAGDSGVVYQDSIVVVKDSTIHPPTDTLKAPGGIRGLIRLQPGDDARTVFILFMGTNTWGTPDDSTGKFGVTNMAEGIYRVRILTTLDAYVPKDTALSVTAGKVDTLTHDIVLQYNGIPVPSGLTISYDTLKQIVTLTWNKPTTGRKVAGYNLYRKRSDSTSFVSIKSGVADTVYRDSTGVQDQTYEYRVAAVDTQGTEGVKSVTDTVAIVSAFKFIKNFGTAGTGAGQLLTPADIAVDDKGRFWLVDGNRNKIMCFDNNGTFLTEWGVQGDSAGQLNNPYGIDIDSHQDIIVCEWDGSRVEKFDTLGNLLLEIDSVGIKIHDVSVDEKGSIYFSMITNGGLTYICKYDSAGKFLKSWQPQSKILHYALLARNGKVYSAGTILSTIQNPNDQDVIEVFDTAGTSKQTVNIRQSNETGVIQIRDMDIDATGNLYAVDPNNYEVRIFDSNLNYVTSFGKKGTGTDAFSWITGIAATPNKMVAVTDADLGVIHLFSLPW